jgi:cold shock CspA family protein
MIDQRRFSSMTGTIKRLDLAGASGVITAEDGLMVGFCPSAVLAYDVPSLAIGQVVSFDLEGGRCPKALNVFVQRAPEAVNAKEKRLEITRFRYIGFEHRGNKRVYLFEWLIPGTEKRTFTVDADLALFAKHHVGMQEGPGLCLHLLVEELDAEGTAARTSFQCSLSDREMLAYLASRPVPRAKHSSPRAQHASGVTAYVR